MTGLSVGASQTEILDWVAKRAYELQDKYHGCAQCGLLAIQEAFGWQDEILFRAATGLSGGVGGTRSVCGVISGGALALGMKYGRDLALLKGPTELGVRGQTTGIEMVGRLCKWFEREFGSTICKELRQRHTGMDLEFGVKWQAELADKFKMHEYCCEIQARTIRRVAALILNPKADLFEIP